MKRTVFMVALLPIMLSSCGPSAENIEVTAKAEIAKTATDLYVHQIEIATTVAAGTAEFQRKLDLALEQTITAQPTNTDTPATTIISSPTYTQTLTVVPALAATIFPTDTTVSTSTATATATVTLIPPRNLAISRNILIRSR